MAPHSNANIKAIAKCLVVLIQNFTAVVHKAQHGCMDNDVIGPAVLCVKGEIKNRVEILIRYLDDNAGLASTLIDRNFEVALAFIKAHREKLALLTRDEQTLDIEVVDPVTNVCAQAGFVQRKIFVKRIQRGRPNPAHILAGIVFCIQLRVVSNDRSLSCVDNRRFRSFSAKYIYNRLYRISTTEFEMPDEHLSRLVPLYRRKMAQDCP